MKTKQEDIQELRKAAYQFRATVRLVVPAARPRQLAVERIDEGLLWAVWGVNHSSVDEPNPDPKLDHTPPIEQI